MYDINKTFTEQGLRPYQVFDFSYALDRDDPRRQESKADEAIMSIETWKAKWAPNAKYIPLENAGGSVVRQTDKLLATLERIADEAIARFELNKIPTERLQAGSAKKQLKVKTGGERLSGEMDISMYISLRLEKPHLNIWIKIFKAPHAFSVYYQAGIRKKRQGDWVGEKFTALEAAKAHFFTLIKEAKEGGLLGN